MNNNRKKIDIEHYIKKNTIDILKNLFDTKISEFFLEKTLFYTSEQSLKKKEADIVSITDIILKTDLGIFAINSSHIDCRDKINIETYEYKLSESFEEGDDYTYISSHPLFAESIEKIEFCESRVKSIKTFYAQNTKPKFRGLSIEFNSDDKIFIEFQRNINKTVSHFGIHADFLITNFKPTYPFYECLI